MTSTHIPYGRQNIHPSDIEAINEVLKSDWLTQGPLTENFEKAVLNYCQASYATAVSNGTCALHLAYLACDLKPGDVVWTTPITFVATANAALYCGAQVDFVDIDESTNLDVGKLEEKLIEAKKNNLLPKIVVPVHFSGNPCHMKKIHNLSKEYGFKIVEDASHALGSRYEDKPIGSSQYSDCTVFSFHPVKSITTAEGGMILTNHQQIDSRLKLLRSHGIKKDPRLLQNKNEGPWYYEQVDLGYNYRISDLQCALGLSQLKRLESFVKKRNELAQNYAAKLEGLPLSFIRIPKENQSSYHLFVIQIDSDQTNKTRLELFNALREKNIFAQVHYIPVHLQPYYQKLGFKKGDYPRAEEYYSKALSLPLYVDLQDKEQQFVIDTLKGILK